MQTDKQIWGTRLSRQFYRMPPRPCPYLPGRMEQNVFTELGDSEARSHYDVLSRTGFRRSHAIAYRPVCEGCNACVPVRVIVADFSAPRTMRRVWRVNRDIIGRECPPDATREQFALFARYLNARHSGGEMSTMSLEDYRAMVEDTPLETRLVEFRGPDGRLVGGCLCDRLGDGLSAVYSFFDPTLERRGLGNFMILWLIERARALDLPYVYLGYWIADSPKMVYKERFQPLEALGAGGWRALAA